MRMLVLALLLAANVAYAREDAVQTRTSFARAVREAAPAVVNIYAAKRVLQRVGPALNDPLFNQLFAGQGPLRAKVERSLGSGVIVDASGVLVTNLHVVEGADAMKVVMADGREFAARLINSDEKLDLAVLRMEGNGQRFPAARFGDSDTLQVGDVVLAVGNPFGIGQSVSMGVVSAVERSNAALSQYGQFIQTDVAINPGNSGGALIDSTGALVGINSAIFSKTGTSVGISFAIPASLVRAVVNDIVSTGHVSRPWFGATGQNIPPALAEKLGLGRGQGQGVILSDVMPGSPAARAGIKAGDVIVGMDGKSVTDPAALNERILATPNLIGRAVPLTLWREGHTQTATITFEALPDRNPADAVKLGGVGPLAGVGVEKLSPSLNVLLDLPVAAEGVAITTPSTRSDPRYALIINGIKAGDVLLEVNQRRIRTVADAQRAASERDQSWIIKLQRGNAVITLVAE
ncbi:MAG: trypsin-like peptidase domain-containing protein [Alphaproteobacteria bacterium]